MVQLARRSWSRRCSVITRLSGRHRRDLRKAEEGERVVAAVQARLVGVEISCSRFQSHFHPCLVTLTRWVSSCTARVSAIPLLSALFMHEL